MINKKYLLIFIGLFLLIEVIFNITAIDVGDCMQLNTADSVYNVINNLNHTASSPDAYGCLRVLAENITINLNGYIINGSLDGTASGIYASVQNKVNVINGTIQNFLHGISYRFTTNSEASDLVLKNNSQAGFYVEGSATIAGNITATNLTCFNNIYGVRVLIARDVNISNSLIYNNTYGFYMDSVTRGSIKNNNISIGTLYGIDFRDSNFSIVENNTFTGDMLYSILFGASSISQINNSILSNTIIGNGSDGSIRTSGDVVGTDNLVVFDNNISNTDWGINIEYSDNVNISDNYIINSVEAGIRSYGDSSSKNSTNWFVSNNKIDNASRAGIFVLGSNYHVFTNNNISNIYNKSLTTAQLHGAGWFGQAIYLLNSNHNNITSNTVTNSYDGYYIEDPSNSGLGGNNFLDHNNASNIFYRGSHNDWSSYNTWNNFICDDCYIGLRCTDTGSSSNYTNITLNRGTYGVYFSVGFNHTINNFIFSNHSRTSIEIDGLPGTYSSVLGHKFSNGYLYSNSTNNTYTGIRLSANATYLIFDNVSIFGNYAGTGLTVTDDSNGSRNLNFSNGYISNMQNGIYAKYMEGMELYNSIFYNLNNSGLILENSIDSKIFNNNMSIVTGDENTAGIWVYNSKEITIYNNTLYNLSNGIYLESVGNNTNTINNNVSMNIISNVHWNSSTDSGNGLSSDNASYNIYEYNEITGTDNGIRMILFSTENNFTGNIINGSERGMYISGGYENTFRNNYFYNSSVSGLQMESDKGISMENNSFWDGIIEDNIVLMNSSGNTEFTNITINESAITITNGSLYYRWHFDVNISYEGTRTRVNNATVVITDNLGTIVVNNESTNENGSINEGEVGISDWLIEWMQNSSGTTNYTPYNITVTHSNTEDYSGNFSLTGNLLLGLNLTSLSVSTSDSNSPDSSGTYPVYSPVVNITCWKLESEHCINYSISIDVCPFYSSETECIKSMNEILSNFTGIKEEKEIKKEYFILKDIVHLFIFIYVVNILAEILILIYMIPYLLDLIRNLINFF